MAAKGRYQQAGTYRTATGYRDELRTPIYAGDIVLLTDHDDTRYLGKVVYDEPFGGWCFQLIARECWGVPTGWISMAGFAITQLRSFRQFRRSPWHRLRKVRVSCRGYSAMISTTHLQYAHAR